MREQDSPAGIVCCDNLRFRVREAPYRQILHVPEYQFGDIQKEDYVLDIGANAGAFCLRAARFSRHVAAIEPVTTEVLEENIALNHADIKVIKGALGTGTPATIEWDGCRAVSPTYTLEKMREISGGCDFLKCDAEGAEWLIRPLDLDGIRRIEMELHIPPISSPPNRSLLEYIGKQYTFSIDRSPIYSPLGVMGILHAVRK
jgi:FkbM family methyltransferase